MDDKKYQVFISSTYDDLIKARDKIMETVLSLYHFPVGMEMFSAGDAEQWEIIKETINVSDYYVVIIGHRYGSISESGVSYTEKEYDYAKEKGIPVLAFIRDRDVATLSSEREANADTNKKLDEFIKKAKANKMCDFWSSIDELATKVAIALPKTFRRSPRIGWIRGDLGLSKEVSHELAELSNENRKLREQVKSLESLTSKENPIIKMTIDSSESILLEIDNLDSHELMSIPKKIVFSEVKPHLREFLTEDEIDRYNNALPPPEVVDEYNHKTGLYFLIQNKAIKPEFVVSNIGNIKANDIYITLEFPDIVMAIEEDNIDDFKVQKIDIPESPLINAQRKLNEKNNSLLRYATRTATLASMGLGRDMASLMMPTPAFRLPPIPSIKQGWWSSAKNNVVTLKLNSLIHTRNKVFDDILIVPLIKGSATVSVKIICEEYKVEDCFEIPIIVK